MGGLRDKQRNKKDQFNYNLCSTHELMKDNFVGKAHYIEVFPLLHSTLGLFKMLHPLIHHGKTVPWGFVSSPSRYYLTKVPNITTTFELIKLNFLD